MDTISHYHLKPPPRPRIPRGWGNMTTTSCGKTLRKPLPWWPWTLTSPWWSIPLAGAASSSYEGSLKKVAAELKQNAIDKLPEDIQRIFYSSLEEHFWARTNQYRYLEATILAKAVAEKDVAVITLPPEEQMKITEIAKQMWEEEAKKNPAAAKAVEKVKAYLKTLGHL